MKKWIRANMTRNMRPLLSFLSICGLLVMLMSPANATVFSWQPEPANLENLDHHHFYTWGIDWSIPHGEYVQEAILAFDDINNWRDESSNNWLYIHLLDDVDLVGVTRGDDGQTGGDNFLGQGTLIDTYTDNSTSVIDLTYIFSDLDLLDELTHYTADGNFGFGMDPDCHYWNEGITFTVNTAAVPEPATVFLLGSGLIGLVALRRKFRKK